MMRSNQTMKRLLVAFILLLHVCAYAETPARVRIRVKLPFEPDSPSAVILPVGTLVTVLWAQEDKLMVRYRRVEGLVPAVTINYVASDHPGDIRQYRPDPVPKDSDSHATRASSTTNTYRAQPSVDRSEESTALGSLPVSKIGIGAGVILLLFAISSISRGREDHERPSLR